MVLNQFFCGSANFNHEDREDDTWINSSSPKKSTTKKICCCKSSKKNPYSTRGLDKFATVLADLEDKRLKIIEQIGTQEVSLIRFGYSKSKGWVPIVIRLRNQEQYKPKLVSSKYPPAGPALHNSKVSKPILMEKSNKIQLPVPRQEMEQAAKLQGSDGRTKKKSLLDRSLSSDRCRVPYYWGMIVVLILLCLAIYGRSFAIICTSILWYLLPKMNNKDLNSKRSMKKSKSFVKKTSEKKMGINGFTSFKTVRQCE